MILKCVAAGCLKSVNKSMLVDSRVKIGNIRYADE
jgi:hypothetical protein